MFKTRRIRWHTTAIALAVLGAGLFGATEVTAAPPAEPTTAAAVPRTVTLVTGDTVTVAGRRVMFGPERPTTTYLSREVGGHLTVLPADALGLIGSGRLDRRLFDLTALLAAGQDDAGAAVIPLEVSYRNRAALTALHRLGATSDPGGAAGRAVVRLPKREARAAWRLIRSVAAGISSVRLAAAVPDPAPTAAGQPGDTQEMVGLTVRVLDPAGAPTGQYVARVVGLDQPYYQDLYDADGVVELTVPRGRYLVDGVVWTGTEDAPHAQVLARPELDLSTDTTVELDTRLSKPVRIGVENAAVRPVLAGVGYARRDDAGNWIELTLTGSDPRQLSSAQLGPSVPDNELAAFIQSQWAVPGVDGDFANSPVRYGLLDSRRGQLFTGSDRKVRNHQLARIAHEYRRQAPGQLGIKALAGHPPEQTWAHGYFLSHDLPTTVTEYLEAGPTWSAELREFERGEFPDPLTLQAWTSARKFAAGSWHREVWNGAVLGPSFPFARSVDREGDYLGAGVGMYGDQAGHSGWSEKTDSAKTSLYRDGELIASSDQPGMLPRGVTVPPERARYTFEVEAERSSFCDLSVRMSARWGFDSAKHGEERESLPLWALRFQPRVDRDNSAPAGPVTRLAFTAEPQPEAKVGDLRLPAVELSGDDGKSWQPARVVALGGHRYVAIARTPAGASYISVRAEAADTAGNTVDQEIIRGYAIAR